MPRNALLYIGVPVVVALLFWYPLAAIGLAAAGAFYGLYSRGLFRRLRLLVGKLLTEEPEEPAVLESPEPTMITMVKQAPHELLGVDGDAGTSTIFHTFMEKMKVERNDNLKLNKKGRRLAAAKNELMARRRRQKKGVLENNLENFLADRPVYSGKVVQFRNLAPAALEKYNVGSQIEGLGLGTTSGSPDCKGRGSHRFVIRSQSGRLLSDSREGQVAFLPGTSFVILSREPWRNPDDPETAEGFSFELEEVA
jgi:hypothetical protein